MKHTPNSYRPHVKGIKVPSKNQNLHENTRMFSIKESNPLTNFVLFIVSAERSRSFMANKDKRKGKHLYEPTAIVLLIPCSSVENTTPICDLSKI